jgi:hypothetical protein
MAPNLLNYSFTAAQSNHNYVSDISYLRTEEG